ncbi:hypothetical protein NLJ89_g4924 [Agrocybe chaxingu]|uniref:mitogen-activated protein kinase kinase n=1 Tax=Agrocybe chaxingu TaxID=84603 RepID=A0A9W8MVH2_9AGAR|nr:hypothetical protein NLJ89_g4924 [Agrocybe chaxingu]
MKTIVPREKPAHELVEGFEDFIRLTKPSGEGRGRGLNLVRCYEAYVDYEKDEAKVVMEFCEGGSLHTVRQRIAEGGGIVGEGVVGKLAIGILDGLSFLHEQGIIHRGITPFNVLLTKHGVVKLSEVLVSPTPPWGWDKFSISCLYISPERILGNKPITGPSDVWSMGITLLEFLWHRHPYPDLPSLDLMARIVNGEPPQLKNEEGVRRSPQMKDFFKQLLIVDAASRPDARALKQHPWIVTSMRREVNMKRWIADVWGWPRV